jgi:hypothetical protein
MNEVWSVMSIRCRAVGIGVLEDCDDMSCNNPADWEFVVEKPFQANPEDPIFICEPCAKNQSLSNIIASNHEEVFPWTKGD